MDAKEVQIPCTAYSIAADWYEGKSTQNILLVLTGWTSNRERYRELTSYIVEKTGMSALVLEYSGHGESPFDVNDTRPAQHFLEVICAFDWLKEKYPDSHISVMGTSYGGYMATQLTKYRAFDNLVLRVPAIYQPSDFYTLNGIINSDEGWAAKDAFRRNVNGLLKHPLLSRAANFKGGVLVVVHEHDESVPKETTDAFIKTFNADTYLAKNFTHPFASNASETDQLAYKDAIVGWLIENLIRKGS